MYKSKESGQQEESSPELYEYQETANFEPDETVYDPPPLSHRTGNSHHSQNPAQTQIVKKLSNFNRVSSSFQEGSGSKLNEPEMSNRTEGGGHAAFAGQHNQFDFTGQRPVKKAKGLSASPGKIGDQYRHNLLNGKPPTPTGVGNMFSTQQGPNPGVKKYQPYASSAGSFVPELPGKQTLKLKE